MKEVKYLPCELAVLNIFMKRCVIMSSEPWNWIPQFDDHSIMIIDPNSPESRLQYLLDRSDYSILVADNTISERNGGNYQNERVLWYTSGTTGDSKFYGFSQEQIDIMAKVICDTYELGNNDRYFSMMPLWHGHGQGFYWATRSINCEIEFGSIKNRKKIEQFQPTFITAVPGMMNVLSKIDLHHVRFLRSASSALPDRTYSMLKQKFNVPVIEAFGMTEALSHCFTNPLRGPHKIGSIGKPDGIQAKIDSEQHLWIQGSCVFKAGWIDTGDLASVDNDGYFTLLGRHQDQINVNGIKINPLSIENKLYEKFLDIEEIAIFGEERLHCVYTGNVSQQDIVDTLLQFGSHCRPVLLEQVEHIPKNAAGKISRTLLQQLYV
jgi:oxalate---CoA ligase